MGLQYEYPGLFYSLVIFIVNCAVSFGCKIAWLYSCGLWAVPCYFFVPQTRNAKERREKCPLPSFAWFLLDERNKETSRDFIQCDSHVILNSISYPDFWIFLPGSGLCWSWSHTDLTICWSYFWLVCEEHRSEGIPTCRWPRLLLAMSLLSKIIMIIMVVGILQQNCTTLNSWSSALSGQCIYTYFSLHVQTKQWVLYWVCLSYFWPCYGWTTRYMISHLHLHWQH